MGGSGSEIFLAFTIDGANNAYLTGYTTGGFPTTPGSFQPNYPGGIFSAFVTKLNSTGSGLVYSTYLGGNGNEFGQAIAVDNNGNAIVAGPTEGFTPPGFPCLTSKGGVDIFVAKLNPAGSSLIDITLLGGTGSDNTSAIAVDSNGDVYVEGTTFSNDFPTTTGAFQTAFGGGGNDAFVTKLTLSGQAAPAQVAVTSGSGQTAAVTTQFGLPLVATVTDAAGNPLYGLQVNFTVPAQTGASAILSSPITTACNGQASVTPTANTNPGTYTVTAGVSGVTTNPPFRLTNTAGAPAQIRFIQQPQNTPAGQPINTVTVLVEDAFGNDVANASGSRLNAAQGAPRNSFSACPPSQRLIDGT